MIAAAFGLLAMAACSKEEPKASLSVKIEGIRNGNGRVLIAISEDEIDSGQTAGNAQYAAFKGAGANSDGLTFSFRDLPVKSYYIYVFHDENENSMLDVSDSGAPVEGIGVTAEGSIPRIDLKEGENSTVINTIYL